MAGAITDADRSFIEEWENISVPMWTVMKFDFRGDIKHELISGRRNFTISTAERKITEEKILRKEDNPFRNGQSEPDRVIRRRFYDPKLLQIRFLQLL